MHPSPASADQASLTHTLNSQRLNVKDDRLQSPNVEAAKPMVYITTLVLITVVVLLNFTAIVLRNHLRKKYAGSVL